MQGQRVFGPALALVLLGCAAETVPSPPTTQAPSVAPTQAAAPPGSPIASPTPIATQPAVSCDAAPSEGALVAYVDAGDLWLYDPAMDDSRQLTNDGDAKIELSPAFVGAACLVFGASASEGATIQLLDLAPGASGRTLVEEVGSIGSLAVSPDGSTVLYLHIDYDVDSTFRLKALDLDSREMRLMHEFHASAGRGGSSEDEVSVAWSPDGSAILAVNTHEYSRDFERGAIYVLDGTGKVVEKWAGTHPRWSPDGETVYFRGFAEQDDQAWFAMTLRTMDRAKLGFRPGTNNLVLSPDGRYGAYDTSVFGDIPMGVALTGKPPNVYLYDLRTRREELSLRGGIAALWIAPERLIATNVSQGAPNPNTWGGNWWDPLGTVTGIDVGGASRAVDMTSTLPDAAVYLPR